MSGPLFTWIGEHYKGSWRARVVLKEYAGAAHHDGTPAAGVTNGDLERRTGLDRATLIRGRKELLADGALYELKAPGGRGHPGSYGIRVAFCAEACWSCGALLKATERVAHSDPSPRKGRPQRRKGRPQRPTTETEVPPTGGTSPHPESAPPAAEAAAARHEAGLPAKPMTREEFATWKRKNWPRRPNTRGAA